MSATDKLIALAETCDNYASPGPWKRGAVIDCAQWSIRGPEDADGMQTAICSINAGTAREFIERSRLAWPATARALAVAVKQVAFQKCFCDERRKQVPFSPCCRCRAISKIEQLAAEAAGGEVIAKCEWCAKDADRAFMDGDYVRYSCEEHHDKTSHRTKLDGHVCAIKISTQPILILLPVNFLRIQDVDK